MTKPPLKEYQREGIEWIKDTGRGLLADEPGLGKTRMAIEAFDGGKNLVVAPKLVIEGGVWRDELRKWSADPDNPDKWLVVPYTSLNARQQVGARASSTRPIKELRPEFKRRHFDAFILDEAHYVKGRGTSWTWASQLINRRTDATLPMTGTPIPNWSHELFSILQLLDPEGSKRRGDLGSFWRWAEKWFDCTPTKYSNGMPVAGEMLACSRTPQQLKECLARPAQDPCEHYVRFAQENLGDQWLRRWREDVLDLPPKTEQTIEVPMSAAAKKAYLSLKKDYFAMYEGTEILAWSQGALNVALDRMTASPWLLTREGPPKGGKFEMLRYDLSSRARPTLVLAHYKESVEACAEVARSVGASARHVHGGTPTKQRSEALESFKSGKLDVLVGSLETISEGHTFTEADMAIFFEKSFKPSRNEQAMFRVWRLGQERPVTIKDYVTPNSVDARKRRLLATKTDRQMRMMTAAEFGELL